MTKTFTKPQRNYPSSILPIVQECSDCKKCELYENAFHYVFYRGESPCDVLFLGEAPGVKENISGYPFVGKGGSLLDGICSEVQRDFTYGVTNIVACAPLIKDDVTGIIYTRVPSKLEAEACRPRLVSTIRAASPKLIVLLGKTAKKYLKLPKDMQIEVLELSDIKTMLKNDGESSLQYQRAIIYLNEKLGELGVG